MPESHELDADILKLARELRSRLQCDGWNEAWSFLANHPSAQSIVARSANKHAPRSGIADRKDAAEEVWLKFGQELKEKAGELAARDDNQLAYWILGTAKFESLSVRTDKGVRSLQDDKPEYADKRTQTEQRQWRRRRIRAAFHQVSPQLAEPLRALFHLRQAGVTQEEMATALGVSIDRIRSLLDKLKKQLAIHLDLEEIDSEFPAD